MYYYKVGYLDAMAVPVSRRNRWILLAEEAHRKSQNVAASKQRIMSGGLGKMSSHAAGRR